MAQPGLAVRPPRDGRVLPAMASRLHFDTTAAWQRLDAEVAEEVPPADAQGLVAPGRQRSRSDFAVGEQRGRVTCLADVTRLILPVAASFSAPPAMREDYMARRPTSSAPSPRSPPSAGVGSSSVTEEWPRTTPGSGAGPRPPTSSLALRRTRFRVDCGEYAG